MITGAGGGIGSVCAIAMASEGASVVAVDVNVESGRETSRLIEELGGDAIFAHADVTRVESVEAAIASCMGAYGRLDALVSIAGAPPPGVVPPPSDPVLQLGAKVAGSIAAAAMPKDAGGSIINIAGEADADSIEALTQEIARDQSARGIRANTLALGVTYSPRLRSLLHDDPAAAESLRQRQPLGICEPEDIAKAAVFLASDDARMITGQVLRVDGGRTLST